MTAAAVKTETSLYLTAKIRKHRLHRRKYLTHVFAHRGGPFELFRLTETQVECVGDRFGKTIAADANTALPHSRLAAHDQRRVLGAHIKYDRRLLVVATDILKIVQGIVVQCNR